MISRGRSTGMITSEKVLGFFETPSCIYDEGVARNLVLGITLLSGKMGRSPQKLILRIHHSEMIKLVILQIMVWLIDSGVEIVAPNGRTESPVSRGSHSAQRQNSEANQEPAGFGPGI